MTGIAHKGQTLLEAMGQNSLQLVSSDSNGGTLAGQQMVAQLQEQGFTVETDAPATTSTAFNAQVSDVKTSVIADYQGPTTPGADYKSDFGFG